MDVEFDLFELMDEEVTDSELTQYCAERFHSPNRIPDSTLEVELAWMYLRYDLNLKKLIREIGIEEVKKVIKELDS